MRWSLFLITLLKRDSNTGVFCEYCKFLGTTFFIENLWGLVLLVKDLDQHF